LKAPIHASKVRVSRGFDPEVGSSINATLKRHILAWKKTQEEGAMDWNLEGLLQTVDLKEMVENVRACTNSDGWRRRILHCIGAATLKLLAPNEVGHRGWTAGWHLTT